MGDSMFFFKETSIGLDQKIYRYMDGLELQAILSGTFSVPQKGKWIDKRESGDIKAAFNLSIVNEPVDDKDMLGTHKDLCKRIFESKDMFASCWTLNQTESMLMWQAYTKSKYGVLIESTIGDFVHSLNLPSYSVICAPIQYNNRIYQGMSFYEALFTKSLYYQDERELRFYFEPNSNGCFHIEPERMIKKVILNPFLDDQTSMRVTDMLIVSYPFLKDKVCNSKIRLNIK